MTMNILAKIYCEKHLKYSMLIYFTKKHNFSEINIHAYYAYITY